MNTPLRLALVHDWLNQVGGAEDVLTELVGMYPRAPIYTSIYWRDHMPAAWKAWDIRPLWMDRLPAIYRHHQPYLPLYPLAFGGLRLADVDVVLSNKSGFCHGVRVAPGALHICYCLAPTRYVWQYDAYAARERFGGMVRGMLRPLLNALSTGVSPGSTSAKSSMSTKMRRPRRRSASITSSRFQAKCRHASDAFTIATRR